MASENYILVRLFCERTKIDDDFVKNLQEYGLVAFEERENDIFIEESDISQIEKMFRLHRDLGINYEGLDVINQMLQRLDTMHSEMEQLKKKLYIYE